MDVSAAQNEVVIPNLTAGKKYQIDVFAVNRAGLSAPFSTEAATKQGEFTISLLKIRTICHVWDLWKWAQFCK